jgi:DnaK suppressor protein
VIPNRKSEVATERSSEERARQLRELLAEMRAHETQWMRTLRNRDSFENSTLGDEGDSAASDEGLELTASLAELAGNRTAAVESALRRFRDGSYGLCEECGEEIPVERLKTIPTAVLCVDCQRELETSSRKMSVNSPDLWIPAQDSPSITADLADPESAPLSEESTPRKRRGRPRSHESAAAQRQGNRPTV